VPVIILVYLDKVCSDTADVNFYKDYNYKTQFLQLNDIKNSQLKEYLYGKSFLSYFKFHKPMDVRRLDESR